MLMATKAFTVHDTFKPRVMARFWIRDLLNLTALSNLPVMIKIVLNKPRLRFHLVFVVRHFLVCKVPQPEHASMP